MSGFTSLHRPTGPHFMDLSGCPVDDSTYDEAFGPIVHVHRQDDDVDDTDDFEDAFFDDAIDEEVDKGYLEGNFDDSHRRTHDGEIAAWIESKYGNYVYNKSGYSGKVEPSSCNMHSGCKRPELSPAASWDSHKISEWKDPKRNRGRKVRKWWSVLAKERRGGYKHDRI